MYWSSLSVVVVASASTIFASTPSPEHLGDITILASDDLRTSDVRKTSAALLLKTSQSQADAEEACEALGEALWSPLRQDFNAGLNSSLAYEVYAGYSPADQLFWVASGTLSSRHIGHRCTAIEASGACHTVSCDHRLPALCTQSASASNSTFADTSAPFRIAQPLGEQILVGYRDFYTFRFLGVRFAEEPERFTYSSKFEKATGTNLALDPAPECLQAPHNGSTDCLFLNIWTPTLPSAHEHTKNDLRPVMVYIYGGGFATGSASNPTNDGGNQAARGDVVVVDLVYRLNSLGFLALEDGFHNGYYWISDLIAGLKWIEKYIAAFGGDPTKTIIYGESAGAQSVQALLASPKAIGLFRGAILQSNYLLPYVPLAEGINQTTNPILRETGCAKATNQLACLQAYNATALINLKTNFNYPVVDDTYLLSTYIDLNSSAAKSVSSVVPVITGVNRDEAGVLVPLPSSSNYTEAIYELAASQPQDTTNVTAILTHRSNFPIGTGPSCAILGQPLDELL